MQTLRAATAVALIACAALPAHATSVDAYVQPAAAADVPVHKSAVAPLAVAPAVVELGDWAAPKSAAPVHAGLVQVGAQRAVAALATPAATGGLLHWSPTAGGGSVAALSVVSNDAFGMRLGLQVEALPADAILRIYTEDFRDQALVATGEQVLQTLQRDASAAERTWWTPAVDGDTLTLEIELPAGVAPSAVQVAMPEVLHIYENIFTLIDDGTAPQTKLNEAGSCTLDSTCYDAYASQRNAVARMLFVKEGGGFLCTGTLLNDRNSTGTPYFLTANHCISSQAAASSLQTFWFYRTPSCNSRLLSSASQTRAGGAQLLHTQAIPDMSLLQLNDKPPAGAVFAAWDSNPLANRAPVVGIHHPKGDLQKISFGSVVGTSACTVGDGYFLCTPSAGMTEGFYRVQWSEGMTEGGSSGSGLFAGGALTGVLSNGSGSCTVSGGYNHYARLDQVFPALRPWLYADAAPPPPPTPGPGDDARAALAHLINSLSGGRRLLP